MVGRNATPFLFVFILGIFDVLDVVQANLQVSKRGVWNFVWVSFWVMSFHYGGMNLYDDEDEIL